MKRGLRIDIRSRVMKVLFLTRIPHCILVDPNGSARCEEMPRHLDGGKLEHFLDKHQ